MWLLRQVYTMYARSPACVTYSTPHTAPIFSAVFDSRINDLVARLLSYTWSKPFNSFNDNQLFTLSFVAFSVFVVQANTTLGAGARR